MVEQPEAIPKVNTMTVQTLATRLHISPKKLRSILRTDYPRDAKNQRWEIPLTVAKKVEKEYKAKVKEKEAKKQAVIDSQLKGEE